MNSPPVLCGTSRERTAIFPEHMNSPPVLCGLVEKELISFQRKNIYVQNTTHSIQDCAKQNPHKTGGEFKCSGKIAVLSLLVPRKTGGEFMCSGKIAVPSLLDPHTEHMNSLPVLCGTSRERTAIFPQHMNSPPVL
jgi:hypothetical protein